MPVMRQIIDVLTMKSDRPLRRLVAYYVILAIIVAIVAFFFPATIARVAAKGLGDVAEGPTVLTDALSAPTSSGTFGLGSLLGVAITTVSILFNFVLLITWHYDYGRNMLMPTAAAQWSRPLQALASPTGDHQIPDRDLLLSLTPEGANALADRFGRVRDAMGKKKKARYNSVLTITTDNVPEAQKQVEQVLDRMTKRWDLDELVTNVGKPSELYYLTRIKKSTPRDVLLAAIHENAGDVIASADIETGELANAQAADKG